ncbi:hypothetical protein FNH22_00300 [Fulvivirga sp. M361]|uniref:DUF6702 family protein n=1 Tax=Fulvivirga sp. M361 TaxID=2594266 RepID=UPI00117B8846|nr:DUF6702 family protein [Fulvivirga sp. M361]TRX62571.1 hypothetical protein FNH22_00300 [Fulvivirga sp. M361]
MLRFLILVVYPCLFTHPLHVSVCEIEYDQESATLEIVQRVFIDDLEMEISNDRNDRNLDLFEPSNGLTTDQMVSDYLMKRLSFEVNGKPVSFNYLGYEEEWPALFCYVEIPEVESLSSLKVRNEILTNVYNDQINIVHINANKKKNSMKLVPGKVQDELKY